ncbi:MAG TPA: hypothetical protein VFD66_05000 [Verrucomicrobiae bacterium]|nr:hypothetical protein [Verrucomicrobiae bacterium]
MTRKNIFLSALFLLLAGLCVYLYKDRFLPSPIQIGHRSMAPRGAAARRSQGDAANMIGFLLNRELRLSSVKVFAVSDIETNKTPQATWDLVSDSDSVPVKSFIYGENIRGMRPSQKGAKALPLRPGVNYRLMIKAGSHAAQHDFVPQERSPANPDRQTAESN